MFLTDKQYCPMPKSKTFALVTVLSFASSSLAFSQASAPLNPSSTVKQVNEIVIGKKADHPKEVLPEKKVEVATQKAVYPGSIKVVDIRDNIDFQIIPEDDEVIAARIKRLENIMPMPYNEHVKKYIDYFLYKRPNFVKQMLEKKEFYFPVFEKYLAKHGIPDEMKYLSLLESGLNPTAVSHAKAVGLWQFMSPTGREYGLTINNFMDERMHIEKSTDASFRYLTWLYNYFNDWELALASYNTGPGNIRRAIRKSGQTDYWSLHNYIHRDTRAYVPQWAALNYLMNYSAEHGIFRDEANTIYPVLTENLLLNGPLNLASFASLNYLDYEILKRLNPHMTKDEIPSYAKNIEIKIPRDTYAYFEANKKCILDSASILEMPSNNIASVTDDKGGSYHIEKKSVKAYHRVRSGEYLGSIATKHGVGVSELKKWNNLRSSTIQKGQKLAYYKTESIRIYDAPAAEVVTQSAAKVTLASNLERSNVKVVKEEPSSKTVKEEAVNIVSDTRSKDSYKMVTKTVKKYHSVRSGENLTDLARKYDTSIAKLMQWNDMKSTKLLKGKKLVYYVTVSEKVFDNGEESNEGIKTYTVQAGDTLWNISQRYGYSVDEIKKLNGMSDNNVKVGQKLKVKA